MFTSNYRNLAAILPPLAPIGISRGKPRWFKGGWLSHVAPGAVGRNFDELAPSAKALKSSDDEYDRLFAAQLAALDPAKVYAELGENAVLLCFCPVDQRCHRRIVAEWLEAALGILIPELGQERDDTYVMATPAYPFWMEPAAKLACIEARLKQNHVSA